MATRRNGKTKIIKVNGRITYLDLSGFEPNSAQITFVIKETQGAQGHTISINDEPTHKKQVFAAAAAILMRAVTDKEMFVQVEYRIVRKGNKEIKLFNKIVYPVPSE